MKLEGPLCWATYLDRPNRFTVTVRLQGTEAKAHLADPGRLKTLLVPGKRLLLRRAAGPGRKTDYDVVGVQWGQQFVPLDSRMPAILVREALQSGMLEEFRDYALLRSEPAFGQGRFDFLLDGPKPCLVEVKGVTLEMEGVALFPDAPTARGRRHMRELAVAHRQGFRACVIFVVMINGAAYFRPHRELDPGFARALEEAVNAGVEALAYRTRCADRNLEISGRMECRI